MSIDGMFDALYQRAYEMRILDFLLRRYTGDNIALLAFCAERDARVVREAIEGWGTDKETLIHVLCGLNKHQLRQVDAIYKRDYKKTLQEELDGELTGLWGDSRYFKYFMRVLLTPEPDMDAELLKDSMEGFGTDENLLTEIVCTRSNKELKEADKVFVSKHGRNVAKWVSLDTSGRYQRFLVRCLQGDINEALVDVTVAHNQAMKINAALRGENEEVLFDILAKACSEQLTFIQQNYRQQFALEMVQDIEDKMGGIFKGDFSKAIEAKCTNKYEYLAKSLEKAFKGIGTDEFAVTRILARYTKSEVNLIGEFFLKQTGESLQHAISRETSGNYKKALLAYLYGRVQPEKEE